MNDRGINGSTPSEALHFILQGYYMYVLSQFSLLKLWVMKQAIMFLGNHQIFVIGQTRDVR